MAAAAEPEMPRAYIDMTLPDISTYTEATVSAGESLQTALDNATCGTVLKLEAGATFTGNFRLRSKNCTDQWIVITTTRLSELPAPGTWVSPLHKDLMPTITTVNAGPAISIEPKTSHYRFIGIKLMSTGFVYNLIWLDSGSKSEEDLPSHFIFDRVYVHGNATSNVRRGITPNGRYMSVIDS